MSHVYVIGPKGGPYKIGTSSNPVARLRSLQTGSPVQLFILFRLHAGHPRVAQQIEHRTHERLRPAISHWEWFNVSLTDARDAVMEAGAHFKACRSVSDETVAGLPDKRLRLHPTNLRYNGVERLDARVPWTWPKQTYDGTKLIRTDE